MKQIIKETTKKLSNGAITKDEADKILFDLFDVSVSFPDNTKLRQVVIGQSGYGMDGCKLCGSKWMRRPYTEKSDHKKDCPAYPKGNEC